MVKSKPKVAVIVKARSTLVTGNKSNVSEPTRHLAKTRDTSTARFVYGYLCASRDHVTWISDAVVYVHKVND